MKYKIINMFKNITNLFTIFKSQHPKIHPYNTDLNINIKSIGNRERSKTEYDFEDYQDILYYEYLRKRLKKNNKTGVLRIRSISF